MNAKQVRLRAQNRLDAIAYSRNKIQAKILLYPERAEAYKQRLAEYDLSVDALKLEQKTGRPMRIGGGVVVNVPAGEINLEGNV